jgi:hypothetical protein
MAIRPTYLPVTASQSGRPAWTRADLVHCTGQALPDDAVGRAQEYAWRMLDMLTSRARMC